MVRKRIGFWGWEICVIDSSKLYFFEKDVVTVLGDYCTAAET